MKLRGSYATVGTGRMPLFAEGISLDEQRELGHTAAAVVASPHGVLISRLIE